jgi:hypothetical protein
MSSIEIYKKNSAILKAGKTRPTIGTNMDGKYAEIIFSN